MRILHVLDHSLPLHSGYAFRSAAILHEQQRLGWTTLAVTGPKHACDEPEQSAGGERYLRTGHTLAPLGRVPVLNQADVVIALRRRLARLAREFGPDVIHAHSPCLNGLAAGPVARDLGIPLVYELRASWEDAAVSHGATREGSLRYRLSRLLETRVVRDADAVVTICEGLRRDVVARGVAPARVTVVGNAVDPEHFGSEVPADVALRARYCAPSAPLLGFLGSFYAYEGLDILIEAMPALIRQLPGAHLLLAGGGPEQRRLEALVARLGIIQAVTFAGRVPPSDVPALYAVCDLLVYPRRRMRLTDLVTPLKPLEAMAQRRLVAASDVGGHRELIRDGETGLLFPPDDPGALVASVTAILGMPGLDAMRARAREYVERERTWKRVVANYQPVYERLLAAQGAAAPGERRVAP